MATLARIKAPVFSHNTRGTAKVIQSGGGVECEGVVEGAIETDADVTLGAKATWKGTALRSQSLSLEKGACLDGHVTVPWVRET